MVDIRVIYRWILGWRLLFPLASTTTSYSVCHYSPAIAGSNDSPKRVGQLSAADLNSASAVLNRPPPLSASGSVTDAGVVRLAWFRQGRELPVAHTNIPQSSLNSLHSTWGFFTPCMTTVETITRWTFQTAIISYGLVCCLQFFGTGGGKSMYSFFIGIITTCPVSLRDSS